MYLVDTNVVSAGAPTQAASPSDLVAWMDRNSTDLYLSVITVAEVEAGILAGLYYFLSVRRASFPLLIFDLKCVGKPLKLFFISLDGGINFKTT